VYFVRGSGPQSLVTWFIVSCWFRVGREGEEKVPRDELL
jgi:hypothetical protein